MAMPVFDIPWADAAGATLHTIALRGSVLVGADADHRYYVGRRGARTITTIAGPVTAEEALDVILREPAPACDGCQTAEG